MSTSSEQLHGIAATHALASRVAADLRPGSVIGLVGEFGAGKTEFTRIPYGPSSRASRALASSSAMLSARSLQQRSWSRSQKIFRPTFSEMLAR